jgi:hypothetical protein
MNNNASTTARRPLKAFISYASADRAQATKLHKKLIAKGIDAWIDVEELLPGQDWKLEIDKALHASDAIIICISNQSMTKEGYVQKELKHALDLAQEKPEGTIFLIPVRLENCQVPFRLKDFQWVDLFERDGFSHLEKALASRAQKLTI